jgi:hypothetical protein
MDTKWFRVPVVVYTADQPGFVLISTVEDASDFLFNYWAGNDSDTWIGAMRSCDGGGAANAANAAFLAALKGAGMRYGPAIELH